MDMVELWENWGMWLMLLVIGRIVVIFVKVVVNRSIVVLLMI